MLEIVKSSEFNARAVKPIDIKNKIPGYNFSYPVLNTIDICNILMLGGSIEISIERMGKSKWSYNLIRIKMSFGKILIKLILKKVCQKKPKRMLKNPKHRVQKNQSC